MIPWNIHNFRPEDLIGARFDSPALLALKEDLAAADGLIVATPIYKASFSGALKTLLDLLPERALEHKVVLPLATGGTLAHMLAVDYALKPVLNALKAQEVLHGVFADDSQIAHYDRTPEISDLLSGRLDDALATFTTPCNSAKRDWRRRYKEKRMKSVIRQFIALLLPGLLSVSAALHASRRRRKRSVSAIKRLRQHGVGEGPSPAGAALPFNADSLGGVPRRAADA